MDKLTVMSCVLFFIADAFAIVAISMPDWIVTNVGGKPGNGSIRLSLSSLFLPTMSKYFSSFQESMRIFLHNYAACILVRLR